jgi:hypothetical protein
VTDDALHREFLIKTFVQLLHLDFERARLQCPLDENLEPLDVHRLRQKIHRASLHRLHRRIDAAVGGHHDDGRLVRERQGLVDDLEAAFAGHAEIGDDHVELLRIHQVEALIGARGDRHVVIVLQRLLQPLTGVLLVVDDQNTRHHAAMKPPGSGPVNGKRDGMAHLNRFSIRAAPSLHRRKPRSRARVFPENTWATGQRGTPLARTRRKQSCHGSIQFRVPPLGSR